MQKILYFMPDNPLVGKAGNLTRAKQMLDYFKAHEDELEVDFLSVSDWGEWNEQHIEHFKKSYPNIKLHLAPRKISKKNPFKRFFLYKIPNFFPKLMQGTSIDISSFLIRNFARKLIDNSPYDKVIVSYASWGNLVKGIKNKPYLICDTHDFITAQNKNKRRKIGRYFQSEINILRRFDEIWTYSIEEKYIFEQFTGKKTVLMPISFSANFNQAKSNPEIDIIYVASKNPHNIAGVNWFLKEVMPYLKGIKVHMIGRICDVLEPQEGIVMHGLVDDLDEYCRNAKIAICPMLSGTGIKIKVLEALSFGLPVVTNTRGVDGLANKKNNGCLVTDDPEEFAVLIKTLLNDSSFYDKVQRHGEHFFMSNHSIEQEMRVLDSIFLADK